MAVLFIKNMNKIICYLARITAILLVVFFALFILEGFGPDFNWQDSVSHLILTAAVLIPAMIAFKRPEIGGWIFVAIGAFFMFFLWRHNWGSIIIGGALLITGILFLLNPKQRPPNFEKQNGNR